MISAKLFYRTLNAFSDLDIPLDTGDFRLLSRRALDALNSMPEHHRFIRGMVSWIGMKQTPILYDRHARIAGSTKYPIRKMIQLAIDAITSFSVRPLKIASYLGLFFAALSTVTMLYVAYSWVALDVVAGWTSVMAVTLLLGSIQLIILGLIGEYIGRTYVESKRRPLYVIEDIAGRPGVLSRGAVTTHQEEQRPWA
jgi:dolichol-phosphate mannosyltransferase